MSSSRKGGDHRGLKNPNLERGLLHSLTVEEYRNRKLQEFRQRKYFSAFQRKEAVTKAMTSCRMMRIFGLSPSIYLNENGYSFGGLATCNNPYCVHCSRKRAFERTEKIRKSILGAREKGFHTYFLTLTMRRSADIVALIKKCQKAWKAVQNKLDKIIKKKLGGKYSTARALDVTFQTEGWLSHTPYNLHLHCILIVDADLSELSIFDDENVELKLTELEKVSHLVKGAWCNSTGDSEAVGQHIEEVKNSRKVSRYLSKMAGLALELSASNITKKGKKSNTMSFPQLMDAAICGSEYALYLYKDFLRGMKGKKTLTFSRDWEDYAIKEPESSFYYKSGKKGKEPFLKTSEIAKLIKENPKEEHWVAEDQEVPWINALDVPEIAAYLESIPDPPVVVIPDFWWVHCKDWLDDIGSILWRSKYMENGEHLREFQYLMSLKSWKDIKEEFPRTTPSEEFSSWLFCGVLGEHFENIENV